MTGMAGAPQAQHGQEDPNSSGDESDVSLEDTPGVPLVAPTQHGRHLPSQSSISMDDYKEAVMDVYITTLMHAAMGSAEEMS